MTTEWIANIILSCKLVVFHVTLKYFIFNWKVVSEIQTFDRRPLRKNSLGRENIRSPSLSKRHQISIILYTNFDLLIFFVVY